MSLWEKGTSNRVARRLLVDHVMLMQLCPCCSYERNESDYIEKLKKGYHSCLGVGKTEPNPDETEVKYRKKKNTWII